MTSTFHKPRRRVGARWLGGLALVVLPTWLCLAADKDQQIAGLAEALRAGKDGFTDADRALMTETQQFSFAGRLRGQYDNKGFIELRDKLRKRFPVESMADRLSYEGDRREALVAERKLRAGGDKLVEKVELLFAREDERRLFVNYAHERADALAKLHGDNVNEFASAAGFGAARMPSFRPGDLFVKAPRLPFESGPALSSADDSGPIELPKVGGVRSGPAPRWPALTVLDDFNSRATLEFVNPLSYGFIKDREHVTGFAPHNFRETPHVNPTPVRAEGKDKEHWSVRRLELVSLLKEEKPAVYVSDHLPSMNDLKDVERRPLGTFEEDALPKLRKGENLVAAATTNRIVMLGAVRAAKQCLKCHDVERGDLLGAFSYELQRDPLAKPAE